ncbi:hypothetical protein BC833DRAFT_624163 [Globomyces pollinis-pini]|nr:hypothetical protein BC833DRAFT_624163 [Globomyces pollinis-pini]
MDWGMNTDISKSFQLLLKMCRDSQKKIKKVFIFSDMQFDQGTSNNSTTHFNQLRQDFNKYEMEMPTIIFWNLQGLTSDFPVQSNDRGVVMLSGFSPSLLKAVMEGKNITPMMILFNIIHQERYDRIQAPSS